MRVLYHLSTIWQPLADALHYQNHDVIKILEKHGSKLKVLPNYYVRAFCLPDVLLCSSFLNLFPFFFLKIAPMHVKNVREVPEYEISPNELDFTNGNGISKVCIYEYVSLSFLFEIFS